MDFEHSDGKLFAGLAKVQRSIEQPAKDSKVSAGSYSYSFATLNAVIATIQMAEDSTGIGFTQNINSNDDGSQSVTTIIYHESGSYVVFDPVTINATKKAQDAGSAISYARRYSLQTAFGIAAEEDDDGKIANDGYQQNNQQRQQPRNNGYQRQSNRTNQRQQGQVNQAAANAQRELAKQQKEDQIATERIKGLVTEIANSLKVSEDSVRKEAVQNANINVQPGMKWSQVDYTKVTAQLLTMRNALTGNNIKSKEPAK